MKAIVVTGSRAWRDVEQLGRVLKASGPDVLIHGGCQGADLAAEHWAYQVSKRDVEVIAMPAMWRRFGNSAGPRRNEAMLRVLLSLAECGYDVEVHGFVLPSSRGTWNCINRAKQSQVPVYVHHGRRL